jgi:hypothetical protein
MAWIVVYVLIAGRQDAPLIDELVLKLEDDNPQVRQEAEAALGKRWPDEALKKRMAELRDRAGRAGNPDLRERAERILKKLAAFDDFATALRSQAKDLREKAEAVPMAEDALRRIAADANRPAPDRAAAAALLGSLVPEARARELRDAFNDIHDGIRPMHVIRFDMYVRAVDARLKAGNLKFSAEDVPLLARMGLLEGEGLALLGLAHVDDPCAFDVLVVARSTRLGEMGDPVLFGLERFAARDARFRDVLAAELDQGERRAAGWMRALAALLSADDPRAVAHTTELLNDLGSGKLAEAPVIGSSRLVSLVTRHPHADYAGAIRAWILRGGVPLSELAGALKVCGGTLDKLELWSLIEKHTRAWEVATAAKLLVPLLDESDRGRLAAMLGPEHWKTESFYVRFDLLDQCDVKLISKQVSAALWSVVGKCDHGFYRSRAVRCAARVGDPADTPRLQNLVGQPADVGPEALRALLRRSERPLELALEVLGSQDPARSRTALELFGARFLSSGECPIPKTEESCTRIASKMIELVDAAESGERAVLALRALYTVLTDTPRPRLEGDERKRVVERVKRAAERHPTDAVRHLVKICLGQLE